MLKRRIVRSIEDLHSKNIGFKVTKFTRRQVLKSLGMITAGTAITSVFSQASGCKSSKSTPAETAPSVNLPSDTTVEPTINAPVLTGYSYIPPVVSPPVIPVLGCSDVVATDREYTENHIWIKSLTSNIAVMGITPIMVGVLDAPYALSLSPLGTMLAKNGVFGAIEGYKLSTDLLSGVSGTIIELNSGLTIPLTIGGQITAINNDPYNSGWMVVIQLSKPNEMNTLMSPKNYADFVAFPENKQGGGL
jgi:glycine cleavage system H protein